MKKYVLYGTGWKAEQFLYNFPYKDEIAYCLNTYSTSEFYGWHVYRLEDAPEDVGEYTIIVATGWEYYEQIRDLLKNRNLVEFKNFVYSDAFLKKIAVINANCYGYGVKKYLEKSKSFMKKYCIWEVQPIHMNKKCCLPEEVLRVCDLYIHQDIRADNMFGYQLSDEYVIPKLKGECIKITIPNMVGMGTWSFPWSVGCDHQKMFGGISAQMFCRDKLIDKAYEHHCTTVIEIMEYMDRYCENHFKEIKVWIEEQFEQFMMKLRNRELEWDIKVSDYILKNYKSEKIFLDVDHPSGTIMKLICQQLGTILGIEETNEIEDKDIIYDRVEMFTPLIVKKVLDIRFEETYIREGNILSVKNLTEGPMDRHEYIRQYIWWYYEKSLIDIKVI